MNNEVYLRLPDMLCFAVYSTGHAFNRVYKPLLDKLGLTYPQYLTMIVLWEQDDQTVGSLGNMLSLESSTLTPLLKRLEAIGYIRRQRDPADERVVRVKLTDEGLVLKKKAAAIPCYVLEATGLTVNSAQDLIAKLTTLRKNLERRCN